MQTHEHADMPTRRRTSAPTREHADTQRANTPTCKHTNAQTHQRANTPMRRPANAPIHRHPNAPMHHHANTQSCQRAGVPAHTHLTHTCPRIHPTPPCQCAQRVCAGTAHHPVVVLAYPRCRHARVLMCSEYPHAPGARFIIYSNIRSFSLFCIMYFCIVSTMSRGVYRTFPMGNLQTTLTWLSMRLIKIPKSGVFIFGAIQMSTI